MQRALGGRRRQHGAAVYRLQGRIHHIMHAFNHLSMRF